jgi:hypothetical protein
MTSEWEQLAARSVLREHRFASQARVSGSFTARLRGAWYNVAARWGDQALIDQQTAYNQAAVLCLRQLEERLADLEERHIELERRHVLADQDVVNLTRTVAELTQQVIQLRQAAVEVKPHPEQDD